LKYKVLTPRDVSISGINGTQPFIHGRCGTALRYAVNRGPANVNFPECTGGISFIATNKPFNHRYEEKTKKEDNAKKAENTKKETTSER
jgi:hypothetical protein